MAGAFARWSAAAEQAGVDRIPNAVRELVLDRVATWDGQDMGLSGRWVEETISPLASPQRSAGRLALLAALASYRVDDQVIGAFRERHPSDEDLIAATAWASYVAARRVNSWLHLPPA